MNNMQVLVNLVIFMSVIIGKIRGQLTSVPGAIYVRIPSSLPFDARTLIVPQQASILPQAISRRNPVQGSSTDRSKTSDIYGNNFNLRPPTLEPSRPIQRLFIPERSPDRAPPPDRLKINSTTFTIDRNNIPVKNQGSMNPNRTNNERDPSSLVELNVTNADTGSGTTNKTGEPLVTIENETLTSNSSKINDRKEIDGTAGNVKPTSSSVVDKATGIEVTLDERASFDGDKCPTGYVRINGVCVEKD